MTTQSKTPHPQHSDSEAERELAEFVKANRQQLPPLPGRPSFDETLASVAKHMERTPEQVAADEARRAKAALARENAERQGRLTALLQSFGARYADCTLDNFQVSNRRQRAVLQAAREFVDCLRDAWEQTGLVLYGPVGTGKDHLACGVSRVLVEDLGKRALAINGRTWFGELRDAIDSDRSERSMLTRLLALDVLVISDPLPAFGALTDRQADMLYQLVHERYVRGLVTICTVNVASDTDAGDRLGIPTWDRLCDGAWKLHCNWPTHRKPAREV